MSDNMKISWPEGWEVRECIGKGGFGSVYLIERDAFGDVEQKALKVISIPKDEGVVEYMRCEGLDDESITTTLYSQVGDIIGEYKTMAKMNENPHIVHCDDFHYEHHEDGIGWKVYIKMELLTPLTKVIDQLGTEAQVVRLGKELCSALVACREIEIVHRDIKPQNIFISPKGNFKLGDFGIARTMEHATVATVGAGTISFMAPEVALGEIYGETVDVYSLGLVMYWLLNERRGPFVPLPPAKPTYANYQQAKELRLKGVEIPRPKNGSKELQDIILKACAFDPDNRYQSAAEMLAALNMLSISGEGQQFSTANEKKDIMIDDATVLSLSSHKSVSASNNTPRFTSKSGKDNGGAAADLVESKGKDTAGDEVKESSGSGNNGGGMKGNSGDGKKKPWGWILALLAVVLAAILAVVLIPKQPTTPEEPARTCSHVWDQADCKTRRTCIACGETGDELGEHTWVAADCINPEKCSLCGETRGSTADHAWMPADCTNPEKCSVCEEIRGAALEHTWVPATYTAPKTCDICKTTSGDSLKKQLTDLLREHLPFATCSTSSEEKVYGYEDAELTQKSESYYFVPHKDILVVTDISEDGAAMEVRYPSRVTKSGYRSLWFPVEDVISLAKIEFGTGKTTAWTNTYRINHTANNRALFGSLPANSEYIVLGTHESGDVAILYSFSPSVVNGLDVQERLALLTDYVPVYSGPKDPDPTQPTEEFIEETLPEDDWEGEDFEEEEDWVEEDWVEEDWVEEDWVEEDWVEEDWVEEDWVEEDWVEEDWTEDDEENWEEDNWEDDWVEEDWSDEEPEDDMWGDEEPVEDEWIDEEPVEDEWIDEEPVEDEWIDEEPVEDEWIDEEPVEEGV